MLQNGGVNATVIPPTQSCFLVADYLDPKSQYFLFAINGEDGTAATGPDLDVWLRFSALYSGAEAVGLLVLSTCGAESGLTHGLAGTGNCYNFYNALPSATHGATPLPQSAVRTTRSPVATPTSPSPTTPSTPGVTSPSTPGVTSPTTPGVTSPSTPGVTSPSTPGVTSPSPTTAASPATGNAGSAGGCGGDGGQGLG